MQRTHKTVAQDYSNLTSTIIPNFMKTSEIAIRNVTSDGKQTTHLEEMLSTRAEQSRYLRQYVFHRNVNPNSIN
jgi:hypothetical protein